MTACAIIKVFFISGQIPFFARNRNQFMGPSICDALLRPLCQEHSGQIFRSTGKKNYLIVLEFFYLIGVSARTSRLPGVTCEEFYTLDVELRNLFCSSSLPPNSTRWFVQRIQVFPHSKKCRQFISAPSRIPKSSLEF